MTRRRCNITKADLCPSEDTATGEEELCGGELGSVWLIFCSAPHGQPHVQSTVMAAGTAFLACPTFGVLCPATRVMDMQKLCRALLLQYYLLLQDPKNLQESRLT